MIDNPYANVQPRYAAYCRFHGRNPEEMLEHDRKKWPGGCMAGFIIWISDQRRKFQKQHPECFLGPHVSDHDAWTEFLLKQSD